MTLRCSFVRVVGVVDPQLCQIQITSTPDSSVPTYVVVAGDRIVPRDWNSKSSLGVGGILRNAGTFANINAVGNPFWRSRSLAS